MHSYLYEQIKGLLTGEQTSTVLFPEQLALRAQTVGSAGAGGFTVGSATGPVAGMLRVGNLLAQAGASIRTVRMDQVFPAVNQGATAYWLSETAECPPSTMEVENRVAALRRVSAWVTVSKQLLMQNPDAAESVFLRDLLSAVGAALTVAGLSGTGGVEPLGLLLDDTITEGTTFGGAPTLAKFCELEKALGDGYAEGPNLTIFTSTAARSKLRQTEGLAGSGKPLWSDDNTVLGHKAVATPSVFGDRVVLGDFSNLQIVLFGEIGIVSDPFSKKKTNELELLVNMHADVLPLRGASFVRSADGAAQS